MPIVAGIVLVGVCTMITWNCARGRKSVGLQFALGAVALLQLCLEGFVWQLLPAYCVLALPAIRRWLGVISLGVVLAPWLMLPFPMLAAPRGSYALGTQIFRWQDDAREELHTSDPQDRREVIVQAWYPAQVLGSCRQAPYMDALDRLPEHVSILPRFLFRRFDLVNTHACLGVAPIEGKGLLPVVVFSPGYGASRSFYTGLLTGLASEGFAVLAVDHPYEAAIVELSDGRVVTTVENFSSSDPDRTGFMEKRQQMRMTDLRFVASQLHRLPFAHALDQSQVAVIGHSFGGASAARALEADSRFQAAANIDGTIYGPIASTALEKPFLLIESDPKDTKHSEAYMAGNQRFLEKAGTLGRRERLSHANHYSFTDVPNFFSPPGRFALSLLQGGTRGAVQTQRDAVTILAKFLRPRQQPKP